MAVIRGHDIGTPDLMLAGAGAAMVIDSLFLPWYGYDGLGWHPTYTGIQSGFLAFFPLLIAVLIGGTAATRAWSATQLPAIGSGTLTWNAVLLIGDAIAALLIVLFWASLPSLEGVATGVKVGTFIGLIVILVQAAGAFLAMVAAGDRLPWKSGRAAAS